MQSGFLDILQVPLKQSECSLSKLEKFYGSDELIYAISSLTGGAMGPDLIKGKKILIKPNWVNHSAVSQDEFCLRTNDNFILAALNVILDMAPTEVIIGDAPIQGCSWDKMIQGSFIQQINNLSNKYGISIKINDFRRRKYDFVKNSVDSGIRPLNEYLIFDLGKDSFLEPITFKGKNRFRVTNYDPDRMSSAHSPGLHKYCITREFFETDVVISLPKIKTHQKAGLTGALKNIVGINGDKDFLPHHRVGGTKTGGDCYPGGSYLRYWSELSLDEANKRQGEKGFWFWQKLASLLWHLSFPSPSHNLAAGWYGNDTTWRMVMDLNIIANYGKADGKLSESPVRQIYSLCDGIIAGQGDGPLEPEPLPLGIISFSNNSFVNDQSMALLLGLPLEKIPLLNNSFNKNRDCRITLGGEIVALDDLRLYATKAKLPKGWVGYLNKTG